MWRERVERAGRDRHGRGDSEAAPTPERKPGRRLAPRWLALIGLVIVLDVVAFVAFPQVAKSGAADCAFPACFIENSLEFPAPHAVIDLAPATPVSATDLVTFHPSISSTILTMWIVMAIVLVGAILMVRGAKLVRVEDRTSSRPSTSS